MTEWYSPKDKLPAVMVGQNSIDVYTATLAKNGSYYYWNAGVMTFNPDFEGKSSFHSIDCYDDCEEPDFWCYFPEIPRELIYKLVENNV